MGRFVTLLCVVLIACGGESEEQPIAIEPSFEVRANAEGMLLTWFDDEGPHLAETRADIPEDRRAQVRVDPIDVSPEGRDPSSVWIADLRTSQADGTYGVEAMPRDVFDALLDAEAGVEFDESGTEDAVAANNEPDVIIYGASWCHACESAGAFLRSRNVPFIERDIETDPGARAEMQEKARAAGVQTGGIPVIDFRGTILSGFDQRRMESLLQEG